MNSLVELQVYSDNHCMVAIVGGNSVSEDLDVILPAQLASEAKALKDRRDIVLSDRPLLVHEFHEFWNILSSREKIEAKISHRFKFNSLMDHLRRVYNDGITRLKERITDEVLPRSEMRERAGQAIALVNTLYSLSSEQFLSSSRLMLIVVLWNLYLIYEVYTALVVQESMPDTLFDDDVDEDNSSVDNSSVDIPDLLKNYLVKVKRNVQVKRNVKNAISQDKNHQFFGMHHEIQVNKYYLKELRKTVNRILSDEKIPFVFESELTGCGSLESENFNGGLISLRNGKYGIRSDQLVEKYIKLLHLVMPFSVKHGRAIREDLKHAKNRVRLWQGPYINERTGCCK